MDGDRRRTGAWLLSPAPWVLAAFACLVLLAATGTWLSFRYRPERIPLRGRPEGVVGVTRPAGLVHDIHAGLAVALYVALAALVVVVALGAVRSPRKAALPLALAAVIIGATFVARSSGSDLPWNALALWAVKANSRFEGIWRAAFDPVVRFVLTDGEVRPSDYRVSVVAHVLAAPAVLTAAVALAWVTGRKDRAGLTP